MSDFRVPLFLRGELVEQDWTSFGGRRGSGAFEAPDPAVHADRLPLGSPLGLADLYQISFDEILDVLEELGRALDFHPSFWPAILNLGIIDSDEGKRLEAIEHFQRVIELDPGRTATAEANYRIAQTFVALGHRKRALRHFTAAVEESPNGLWGEQSKRYMKMLR